MFRRKEKLEIPPVASEQPQQQSRFASTPSRYQSSANTYNASRDGDPYAAPRSYGNSSSPAPPQGGDFRDRYNRNRGVGDVYSRGESNLDSDRNELLGGYKPSTGGGRFYDGPDMGREPAPGEENDDDVEGIKKQTRYVKQESANSTRNALRLAREAEETARNTLTRLGDQSEKLANTERHLDITKAHSSKAGDRTDELKQLNRSIFRPVITFNKDAKRAAHEAKIQQRYEEEREERERGMMDVRESQNRLGRAQTYGRGDEDELLGGGGGRRVKDQDARKAARSRYQFEATGSDDELEDEIDDNLDEIGDAAKRLKALAMAAGDEVDRQNQRIDVISGKTDKVGNRLEDVTRRQKKY